MIMFVNPSSSDQPLPTSKKPIPPDQKIVQSIPADSELFKILGSSSPAKPFDINSKIVQDHSRPLFDIRSMALGTFFGGPLAGGYFFYKNYKNQGHLTTGLLAIFVSIILTVILLVASAFIENLIRISLPTQTYSLIWVGIVYFLFKRFQEQKVAEHKRAGGPLYKYRFIGVAIVSVLIILGCMIGYLKLVDMVGGIPVSD